MPSNWNALLNQLSARDAALRVDLAIWNPDSGDKWPFKRVKGRKGWAVDERFIDWKSFFKTEGSVSIYKLGRPFLGLLYYDVIFVDINPCPKGMFDAFHQFKWAELNKLIDYARRGKVKFYLTDKHEAYTSHEYLFPIFEEFHPLHLVFASVRIAKLDEYPKTFDDAVESATDIPRIRSVLSKFAKELHRPVDIVDVSTCHTLQEIYYYGYEELALMALEFMKSTPNEALPFIWALKRLIVDAQCAAPGVPWALDLSDYRPVLLQTGKALARKNICSVPDIGKVISKFLSFPTPTDWEGLSWCEDNLDMPGLRRAFSLLEDEARTTPGGAEYGGDLQVALSSTWEQKAKSISRHKNSVLWGTSLSLAVAGTFVSGPITGILSALGLAAASNLWLEPLAAGTSNVLDPQAYHIWDMQRRFGRP